MGTASASLPPVVEETAALLGGGRNVLIFGGTGSDETTLLNARVSLLPAEGRVISIEDTRELRPQHANGFRFEARDLAARGVTIRNLVRHALHQQPEHVVGGELHGAEAAGLVDDRRTSRGRTSRSGNVLA